MIDPEVLHSWQKKMEHLESHKPAYVKEMNFNINTVIINGQHCEQQILKAHKERMWEDKIKRQKYWLHTAALCFSTSFTFSSVSVATNLSNLNFFLLLWLLLHMQKFLQNINGEET